MKTVTRYFRNLLVLIVAGITTPLASTTYAGEVVAATEAHEHHHMVMPETTRRIAEYTIPEITLVRDDGKSTTLAEALNGDHPVVLNFIFTTCTAVCPVTSQTFSQLQRKLGSRNEWVQLVSISIDPEQDTPERLAAYAEKYGAGPQWRFYTGTPSASVVAQRAFDIYRGDKMNHRPVTLLRAAADKPWIRIEGFATANTLLAEIQNMIASSESSLVDLHKNHASNQDGAGIYKLEFPIK